MLRNAWVQVLMCHREVRGQATGRRGGQGEEAGVGVAVGWVVGGELHPRVAGSCRVGVVPILGQLRLVLALVRQRGARELRTRCTCIKYYL